MATGVLGAADAYLGDIILGYGSLDDSDTPQLLVEVAFDTDPTANFYDSMLNMRPTSYWRMDALSGTTEPDVQPFSTSYNGTYLGAPTLGAAGALSGDTDAGVTFNGSSQYMTTTYIATTSELAQYTFAAWVKKNGTSAGNNIIIGTYGGASFFIAPTTGYLVTNWTNAVPAVQTITGVTNLCDNTWHFVVSTFDGTTATLYVDGVVDHSTTLSGAPTYSGSNTQTIAAIENGGAPSAFFDGSLDEVAFFANVCLTARQVTDLYRASDVNAQPTWTDISTDVLNVQIKFGRVYELDQAQTGTASLTLDNTSRDYDPINADSPYYPNVLPLRPLRISAIYKGTTYRLFTGFVERWPQTYEGIGWAEVDITAVDGMDALSAAFITGTFASATSDVQVKQALAAANWPFSLVDMPVSGSSTLTASTFDASNNQPALSFIQQCAQSESGLFYVDQNGSAVYEGRSYRTTGDQLTSRVTFGDEDTELEYLTIVPSYDRDHIINHWDVTGPSGTTQSAEDSASIRKYWRRSNPLSVLLDDTDALALAQYNVTRTKDPGFRIDTLTVEPLSNAFLWAACLNLRISDRITVVRRPPGGGSPISLECFIESISWNIQGFEQWQWSVQLSPVPNVTYLTLDDATLGEIDSTNVLGF